MILVEIGETMIKLSLAALEATGWNRVKAAAQLGMPRRTFYRRLNDYGIL